jgi:4-amino-4-deoxy-L-arabinose transferase-like glycosyltransferase
MSRKRVIFLILLVCAFALLFTYKIGSPPLFEEDEAKITEEAREILVTGDWTTLHLNFKPWFHKPPLYMWLTAATFAVLGVSEFTARIWSALFSLGSILTVFFIARILYDEATAGLSAIVLGSSLFFIALSRAAFVDTGLTFFISLSILFFLVAYREEKKRYFLLFSALAMALATMTKGPLGIILPSATIFFYLILERNLKFLLHNIKEILLSIIIYCAAALPWWIAETMLYGKTFLHDLFGDFMVGIYTSTFQKHAGPVYFYVLVILIGMLPWTFHVFRGTYEAFKKDERDRSLLLIAWAAVVFIIFSTAKTKVPGYILPIFPALAILAARSYMKSRLAPRLIVLPLLVSVVFVIAATEFILPAAETYFPSRRLVAEVSKSTAGKDVTYFSYKTWFRASLVFYTRQKLTAIEDSGGLKTVLGGKDKVVIFTDEKAYAKISDRVTPLVSFMRKSGELIAIGN